jgi:hypothetical protein
MYSMFFELLKMAPMRYWWLVDWKVIVITWKVILTPEEEWNTPGKS